MKEKRIKFRFNSLLNIILILLFIFPVRIMAQDIVVEFKDTKLSVEEALKHIETQTYFTVAFNHSELDVEKSVLLPEKKIDLENALSHILAGSECTYKINGKHLIIVPINKKNEGENIVQSQVHDFRNTHPLTYTGAVYDEKTKKQLIYATVSLLDKEGGNLISAVTDDNGEFWISSSVEPDQLKISYLGFKPIVYDISEGNTNLGGFYLSQDATLLSEVSVTAGIVQHKVDRNSYLVTADMRQGTSNAQELLNKIHGVRFDKVSNTIKVGTESDVLLLVDGMQQSQEYIKTLLPERINRIEVVNEPSGRYVSEGYSAIINFILKKDYTGYDINIDNFSILNVSGTNGDDWLATEQPRIGLTYTRNNINIYGMYMSGRRRWNTAVEKKLNYMNSNKWESLDVSIDDPNNIYKNDNHYITAGINYNLTPDHIISIQGDYRKNKTSMQEEYDMLSHNTLFINNRTENEVKDDDYVASLFYKGQVNDRLNLYGDFSYNGYSNNVDNFNRLLINNELWGKSEHQYEEDKKQTVFNAEANYKLSEKINFDVGYSNVWRKYNSLSLQGENFLDYVEYRNKIFLYAQFNPAENLSLKLGSALEYVHINNKGSGFSKWSLQPYLQLNWAVNKTVNLNAAYTTNIYYPTLYQLSSMETVVDTFLIQKGNPALKSAVRHTASVRLTLWDRLSIVPTFKYTPERISEIYTYDSERLELFRTFDNVDVKQYVLQMFYDQPIGNYFKFKSSFAFYHDRASFNDVENSYNGWLMDAEISYYNPVYNLGVDFGYYRNMDKSILLEGYQMINIDNWLLSLSKQFWNNQLSVSLSYIPPLPMGIRSEQLREIDTPHYQEKTIMNLKTYDNMLFLRVGLRFNDGSVKRNGKKTNIEREERQKRTIDF